MKNDKAPKNKTTDSERETRVLLESISKHVQTVAEGHGIIIRKLDGHSQRLDRIENVLDEHTQILNKHGQILDEHTQILNKHGQILDEHTQSLNKHGQILDEHTQSLSGHGQILNGHSQRFDRIERDLDTVKSAVMDISHETKGLASRVKKVEEKVFV